MSGSKLHRYTDSRSDRQCALGIDDELKDYEPLSGNEKNNFYYIEKIEEDLIFIEKHMRNEDQESFSCNEVLQDSMMFRLIQISENAKKLSDDFKEKHALIPCTSKRLQELLFKRFLANVGIPTRTYKLNILQTVKYYRIVIVYSIFLLTFFNSCVILNIRRCENERFSEVFG